MYVIKWANSTCYVLKRDGMNLMVNDPRDASTFPDRETAMDKRPGHGRDMGGNGYHGTVVKYDDAVWTYNMRGY